MSADSAVTYTSVHSEARSWSIPSEDPYEEAARQLLELAPRFPEYLHDPWSWRICTVYIPEPGNPEDLYPRALALRCRDVKIIPLSFTTLIRDPTIVNIPLPAPSTAARAIFEADMPPQKRLLLTTPRPGCEVGESSVCWLSRQQEPYGHGVDLQFCRPLWRPGFEILRGG
ncbi:hypothetical protein Tco_0046768 [Tanacetum coccineum]